QAEDGIRDRNVTGVQTCALPICGTRRRRIYRAAHLQREGRTQRFAFRPVVQPCALRAASVALDSDGSGRGCPVSQFGSARTRFRSEERRVGKECRCWWWGGAGEV